MISYPDTVRAKLKHLKASQMIEVGNASNLIMKQEQLLDFRETVQSLNFPQHVE